MSCRKSGIMSRRVQGHNLPGSPREKRYLMLNGESIMFLPQVCVRFFHPLPVYLCHLNCTEVQADACCQDCGKAGQGCS